MIMKFAGLFFVMISVLGGCVPKEKVTLRSVVIKQVEPGRDGDPLLKADVVFFNPNSSRMRLRRIQIDILVDGTKAASVDQELSALIKANSEFTVPLEVKLKMKEIGLLNTIVNLFAGKKYEIQFVGNMKVKVNGFPLKVPVSYKEEFKL
jgi:LEA14-like dessication related protein